MKVAILTFHNTPNFGATLQCYALSQRLRLMGADVEVINYAPLHATMQYLKFLFAGRRRSLANIARLRRFRQFVARHLVLSGPPIVNRNRLTALQARYELAFVGSDEVWKVDHMRPFDPSFYFDFLDPEQTRLCAFAASASTVTDLQDHAPAVTPLLRRFAAFGIRDPSTAHMVEAMTGRPTTQVLDPTLVWDFGAEDLPPLESGAYVAVYCWLSKADMRIVRRFAAGAGLRVVCVGCSHPDADANRLGIGPEEWLRLIKHASLVVTDFFHGILFAINFRRPFYAFVNPAKRMKLEHALGWVGLGEALHNSLAELDTMTLADLKADWTAVEARLKPLRVATLAYLTEQLGAISPGQP